EVVVALGADVEPGLDLLAEDGRLALAALEPEPLRHAALGPVVHPHAGLRFARSHAATDPTPWPVRAPASPDRGPRAGDGTGTPSGYQNRAGKRRQALFINSPA